MRYDFNEFIKNKDIKQLATNLLYLYKYDRINKDTIQLHLDTYNDVNDASYFIQNLDKKSIELSNGRTYCIIELGVNYD